MRFNRISYHLTRESKQFLQDLRQVYQNQLECHLTEFCIDSNDLALLFIMSITYLKFGVSLRGIPFRYQVKLGLGTACTSQGTVMALPNSPKVDTAMYFLKCGFSVTIIVASFVNFGPPVVIRAWQVQTPWCLKSASKRDSVRFHKSLKLNGIPTCKQKTKIENSTVES